MTDRAYPTADGAQACPFVAFDDARDDRADRPDPRHRCYAENPPAPRAKAHQEAYCLSSNFPVCPTFQDWARREAARVTVSGPATPAERLRDVPAQRAAGGRPVSFGPGSDAAPVSTPRIDDEDRPEPWELPPRRSNAPDWSSPPPWVAGGPAAGGSTTPLAPSGPGTGPYARPADDAAARPTGISRPPLPDDMDAPDFLREAPPTGDRRVWGHRPDGDPALRPRHDPGFEDESDEHEADRDEPGGAGIDPDGREAMMSRLAAMGMGADTVAGPDDRSAAPDAADARPVSGITRDVEPPNRRYSRVAPDDDEPVARTPADAGGRRPGAVVAGVAAEPPQRASGALSRLLGWDRRPRAGSGRAAKAEPREPSWERPRRYEAYPSLKTRVGVGAPSKLFLYAAGLFIAAAVLFFVPPMLLRQGGGAAGPEASSSVDPSASARASARASAAPSVAATPKQVTYTVKQGETLSSIAKKFKITIDQLLAANKQIKNPNKIAIGDVLTIPTPTPSEIVDSGPSAT
jgi:hypothetical protein